MKRDVQKIEQTGKQFKMAMLIGFVLMVAAMFKFLSGDSVENQAWGIAIGFVGLVTYGGGRFAAWWFHG